jgi:hypothetical protein
MEPVRNNKYYSRAIITSVARVDLDHQLRLLREKRSALLHQLDAVDEALAELTRKATPETMSPTVPNVIPTRIDPRRVQSDEHRHASIEGRRKARHSREAAAGRAREALEPAPKSAAAAPRLPRLVKREKRR